MVSRFSLIALACLFVGQIAMAQPMINQYVPMQRFGNSFYEHSGVSWGIRGPGFFANFGGGGVVPPFGNFDPGGVSRVGGAFSNGPVSGNLGFSFGQGSSQSIVSTTPSVTTMNGYPGSISSGTIRPFVTGITPVVGGQLMLPMPTVRNEGAEQLARVQQSQYAEIIQRLQRNVEAKQRKALEDFQRGLRAEESGNLKMARANYRRALASANGPLRVEVIKRMQAHGWSR